MSAHMRKRPIEALPTIRMRYHNHLYEIPLRVIEKYRVEKSAENRSKEISEASLFAENVFEELDKEYSKAGALLKGLRYREALNQVDFAKRINVSQSDLSKMENGKRRVGRILAKRISKEFGIHYRSLLE